MYASMMATAQSWEADLLTALGIPVTPTNTAWIDKWANSEEPNGGFGPGYYSYYQNNPFNIKDANGNFIAYPSAQAGIQGTANWLQSNGGWGGTGTYGQEIKNYLMGLPNQLAKAFAYYSGHSGDTSQLTTSYQQLVGGGGGSSQTSSSPTTQQGPVQQTSFGSNFPAWAAAGPLGEIIKLMLGSTSWPEFVQKIESETLVMIGAVTFIFIGGIWIIFGNDSTKKIVMEKASEALA